MSKPVGLLKGAKTLVSGNLAGQLLVYGLTPVLTRCFTEVELGDLGVFMAVVAILAVSSSFRYELALLIAKNTKELGSILLICFGSLIAFTIVVSIPILLKPNIFLKLANFQNLQLLKWVPIGLIAFGVNKILTFYHIKENSFDKLAVSKLVQLGLAILVQIGFGYLLFGSIGLVYGYLTGLISAILILFFSAKGKILDSVSIGKSFSNIMVVAKRHRKFLYFSSWSDMINILSIQLPVLLVSGFFGLSQAGLFVLAERVSRAPVGLISDGIGKSLIGYLSNNKDKEGSEKLLIETFAFLAMLSIPLSVLLAFHLEDLFSLIFGEKWRISGLYSAFLLPNICAVFISVPFIAIYSLSDKQRRSASFQICLNIAVLFGLFIGIKLDQALISILLYSIFSGTVYLSFGLNAMKFANVEVGKAVTLLMKELCIGLIIGLMLWFFSNHAVFENERINYSVFLVLTLLILILSVRRVVKQYRRVSRFNL